MRNFILTFVLLLLIMPGIAFATPITNVNTFTVGEADMNGMQVKVNFADGSTSGVKKWGQLSSGGYGVEGGSSSNGTDWSLTYNGSDTQGWDGSNKTFLLDWTLSADTAIDNFTINAFPGNTVFDIVFDKDLTLNSSGGIWAPNGGSGRATSGTVTNPNSPVNSATKPKVKYSPKYNATFDWVFTDPVNILGDTAKGDLFTTLFIDFTDSNGFKSTPASSTDNRKNFNFIVDTDNVTPVPEPATLFLFGLGLFGVCGVMKKKIKIV